MNISAIDAIHVRVPLKRPIKHASHSRTETDNLVVRCVLDDGTAGFGEGVPRDYVTGETVESAIEALKRAHLPERLKGGTFEEAVASAAALTLEAGDPRGISANAARCAAELAFLDAAGRRYQRPLTDVARLVAPEVAEDRPRVQYSGIITSSRGLKLKLLALGQRLYGFRQLKVKVGIAGQDDVSRLKSVRAWAGASMDLRVDANEAWKPEEVERRLQELEPLGITSAEQPVAHEEIACLAEVRKRVGIPIMFDESLCGWQDAERAIREGLCDLFNLRLSKCGGLTPSLRLAALAYRSGLGCQLGCQVGETALLSAAGRAFACSVRGLRYVEGSYDGWLVKESLARRSITFGWGGWADKLPGPGLGVEVDPRALERITVRRVPLA